MVRNELRQHMIFARHNLVDDPPFTRMNLVSCRNMLIYLQPRAQDAVLSRLQISQSSRWYRYRWNDAPPIPLQEIIQSSANMHMIPADDAVAAAMQALEALQTSMSRMFTHGTPLPAHPPTAVTPWAPPTSAPPATGVAGPRPAHWGHTKPDWDKLGYCWTHGFKVKVGHNSSTCQSRRHGHQPGATRSNRMGGSRVNDGFPGPLLATASSGAPT